MDMDVNFLTRPNSTHLVNDPTKIDPSIFFNFATRFDPLLHSFSIY